VLFAIASSTATATTTLFEINNTGQLTLLAGTAAAPSIRFVGDLNDGIYGLGGNNGVGFTVNGVQAGWVATNGFHTFGSLFVGGGTTAFPGVQFANDGGTGMFMATDVVGFSTDGIERGRFISGGNFGLGTTSPYAKLSVNQLNGGGAPLFVIASSTGSGATSTAFIIDPLGNVGIGTANPDDAKVEVKGGTVCVDTDGNDTAASCIASESDERLKENITPLAASSSLAIINALNPVSFDWRASDPEILSHWPSLARYQGHTHSIGLIAQEVMPVLPEALLLETVVDSEVQYFQLDYIKFIPHLIGAVKELASNVSETAHLVIDAVTARVGAFGRVDTQELCTTKSDRTEVCVSGDQLAAILAGVSAGAPALGVEGGAPAAAPPGLGNEDDPERIADPATASSTLDSISPPSTEPGNEAADASSVGPDASAASAPPEPSADADVATRPTGDSSLPTAPEPTATGNSPTEQPAPTGTE
jgi:hypothetical protein